MLIAIDAGNRHIRLGGFEEDRLVFTASIQTEPRQTADYYACMFQQVFSLRQIHNQAVTGAVLSSVVPMLTPVLAESIRLLSDCPQVVLSAGVKTGLNIRTEQPRHTGTDRVAEAVAAVERGQFPCVVVDLGTASTFTVLDQSGALVASAITAGVHLSVDALRQCAALLPAVSLKAGSLPLLAHNTEQAIQAGAIYGAASMVDGMITRYAEALGAEPCVLLTGGAAELVSPHLRVAHTVEPDLTLKGLCCIYRKNCGESSQN